MKRLYFLLFLLPSLGSCTLENDYYSDYREPPPRVRVQTPSSPVHGYYPEATPSRSYHHRNHGRREVIVPTAPQHGHSYVAPQSREHGHYNKGNESQYGNNNQAIVRSHGHD